jgi:hypothetical protein
VTWCSYQLLKGRIRFGEYFKLSPEFFHDGIVVHPANTPTVAEHLVGFSGNQHIDTEESPSPWFSKYDWGVWNLDIAAVLLFVMPKCEKDFPI